MPGKGIGRSLRPRLRRHANAWMDQAELLRSLGAEAFDRDIARRVALLEEALSRAQGATLVIGRSSGGRVATLVAARRPLRAVICLGYPFQQPGQPPEPARYAHLAHVRAPTLILQGTQDPYGGEEVTRKYAVSPLVRVEFFEGCHKLRLQRDQWDALAQRILDFCATLPPAAPG